MKILLTGSEGYIGSNMKLFLEEKGINYIGFDRKQGTSVEDMDNLFNADAVIHLAALSGIPNCEDDPKDAAISNISASFNIFKMAFDSDIPLIFASSQAAKNPNSGIYGFTKFTGEQEAFRINNLGGKIRVYRFANVYGGHNFLNKSTVVAEFMKRKMDGKNLVINDYGNQTRDFIHVYDICKAMFLGLVKDIPVDTPIDIGSGESTSILELAKMFNCSYEFSHNGRSGVSSSEADIEKAKNLLGFKSERSLKEFIKSEV